MCCIIVSLAVSISAILQNTYSLVTHQKCTNGVYLPGDLQYFPVGKSSAQSRTSQLAIVASGAGIQLLKDCFLNSMRLIYISPDNKGYQGSVRAAWTRVGSLLCLALREQGDRTEVTSRGSFYSQPSCDFALLYRGTSPSCIAFFWPEVFTLEALAVLSAAAECILSQTEACLYPGERE